MPLISHPLNIVGFYKMLLVAIYFYRYAEITSVSSRFRNWGKVNVSYPYGGIPLFRPVEIIDPSIICLLMPPVSSFDSEPIIVTASKKFLPSQGIPLEAS